MAEMLEACEGAANQVLHHMEMHGVASVLGGVVEFYMAKCSLLSTKCPTLTLDLGNDNSSSSWNVVIFTFRR
ncbi:hypothetical protein V6N11_060998 [Hibiscus sabdariffa]|uniref:Uncharacterized protein n=1 Tax=Hibiscus sabdariffa TaxID=183260 RepID=A0ABR2QRZ3_9ROSI